MHHAAVAVANMAEERKRRKRRHHLPGWKGLRQGMGAAWIRLVHHTSARHRAVVLLVFALGAVLRILRMDLPVTYDEALTYSAYASRSFGFLFSDYSASANHLLHSGMVRISLLLFGIHPWALRLPALLAGLLVMPLGYAFARFVFNRHIAVVFLCMIAVSGPLVEFSAMARGFSLVWLFTLCALLAAWNFVRTENLPSVMLLAVACALGMWTTPAMGYPALMAYAWSLLQLFAHYNTTLRRRMLKLAASFLLALVLVLCCYMPVIVAHSVDHVLHHPAFQAVPWSGFPQAQQDNALEAWAYYAHTAPPGVIITALLGSGYAAYVSSKYRWLLFAMVLGALPLVLLQHWALPPAVWTYALLVLWLGAAIGLFHLLKAVQDKLAPGSDVGRFSLVGASATLLVLGWGALRGTGNPKEHFAEARSAAAWLARNARPGDRVGAQLPWDAPVAFYLACAKGNLGMLRGSPASGGRLFLLVAPSHGQTPGGVWRDAGLGARTLPPLHRLHRWQRLELYTAD